jgi:hypothetical protein
MAGEIERHSRPQRRLCVVNQRTEQRRDRAIVLGERQPQRLIVPRPLIEHPVVVHEQRFAAGDEALALADRIIPVFRVRQLVDELAREVVTRLGGHAGSVQPHPEPNGVAHRIDQHDPAEDIADLDGIDIAPRWKAPAAFALQPVLVESVQPCILNVHDRCLLRRTPVPRTPVCRTPFSRTPTMPNGCRASRARLSPFALIFRFGAPGARVRGSSPAAKISGAEALAPVPRPSL